MCKKLTCCTQPFDPSLLFRPDIDKDAARDNLWKTLKRKWKIHKFRV